MILNDFKLTGKVAIVTGARTGLGQGMAFGLAEAGADIVVVGRYNLNETRKGVEERGRKFLGIEADLSDIKVIENIINQTVQKFGHMDILINDAGINRRADAIDFSEKDWVDVMAFNLKTVFFFSQAVAKQFIKQKTGGKIINIASMLSFQGGIRVPSYTASQKVFLELFVKVKPKWRENEMQLKEYGY